MVDTLLGAIESLATFRDLDGLRRHVVEVVPTLVTTDMVAWNEVDLASGRIDAVMEPHVENEVLAASFVEHLAEHPVIAHVAETGDGRPHAISDFLSAEAFHEMGIYRSFYRELGAEDQLSFTLPDPRLVIGVALNRDVRGFSAPERQVLNALRPHLAQAYRNAEDFSRLQRSVSAMGAVVERDGEGLVLVDRLGHAEMVTALGGELFGRWFGGWRGGPVPDIVGDWLHPTTRQRGPATPLVISDGPAHLLVRQVPVPEGSALLVTEPRADQVAQRLELLGLTGREIQVIVRVTDGASTAQVANQLGISRRTVEKHVQHAYDKLGVDNRVVATNLVRQLERDRGPAVSSGGLGP